MGISEYIARAQGFSEEHRAFNKSYRLQQCNTALVNILGAGVPRMYAADGSRTRFGGRSDTAECPSCGHQWKVYGGSGVIGWIFRFKLRSV